MRGTRTFPDHIPPSRQWKARKRAELAALEYALNRVRVGCAFTPIRDLGAVDTTVKEWRRLCSVKEWGR